MSKSNRQWFTRHLSDPYVRRAQKEKYRARAAYKLQEIDQLDHLIYPGQIVVDLGAAPGSWTQYVYRKRRSGKQDNKGAGLLIALDQLPMAPIGDVHFIQGDFLEEGTVKQLVCLLQGRQVDVVLSDMAPNLSGIQVVDAARIEMMMISVIRFVEQHMSLRGICLAKCFHGAGFNAALVQFRQVFKTVSIRKPKASRDDSSEVFLLGKQMPVLGGI